MGRQEQGHYQQRLNLSRAGKPVVVYIAPTRQFRTIKTFDDLQGLRSQGDSESVARIVSELHLSEVQQRAAW